MADTSRAEGGWGAVVPFFGANVLFGAGLFAHALLYNFYLDTLGWGEGGMGLAAAALTAGGLAALAPAGAAVDRWGVRPVYLAAVALAAAGLAAGAWAEGPGAVYGAALLAGLGTAGWRVAMGPTLMAAARPELRSRAFSWNVAILLASGAAWTALSGSASTWAGDGSPVGGLRTALWLGALVTALAGPVFLLVPVGVPGGGTGEGRGDRPPLRRALAVPRPVVLLVGAVFVWMLASALVLPFFNLYFQRVQGLAVERIGLVFAAGQGMAALAVFFGGEVAQRLGPRRAFLGWGVLLPATLAGLALGPAAWLAVPLFVLQGLPSPATNPLLDEIVLETAPEDRQGAASSWRNGATEASGLVGAALGGVVLEHAGFGVLLSLAATVAAAGAWTLRRRFTAEGAP